ncbi:hypothetical protein CU098_013109 [Rhizopus stolonifer]|uniref:Uncharacterized protein n=1 Tax=Rhizopus stolonifer TaxID=4846 RepID=A0A367KUN8_RHIST|nr:hypothetical protein CU098_013109 [Rhizopus stolonifer]
MSEEANDTTAADIIRAYFQNQFPIGTAKEVLYDYKLEEIGKYHNADLNAGCKQQAILKLETLESIFLE